MKIYASKQQEWSKWNGYFYVDDVDKALSTVKRFTDLGFKSRYIYTNGIEVGYIIKFRNGEITYDFSDSDVHADWWTDSYIDFKFDEFNRMNICISSLKENEINNLDKWLYKYKLDTVGLDVEPALVMRGDVILACDGVYLNGKIAEYAMNKWRNK